MKIIKVKEVNPRPKKRSEIAGKFESNEKHINNKKQPQQQQQNEFGLQDNDD